MRLSAAEVGDLFNRLKHGDKEHQEWLLAALKAWSADKPMPPYVPGQKKPMPIRLHCPACGELHIDEGEFADKVHHTHACQSCGEVWRPAVEPTVGVRFLPGFKNEKESS